MMLAALFRRRTLSLRMSVWRSIFRFGQCWARSTASSLDVGFCRVAWNQSIASTSEGGLSG